jgi:uncharacterized protein YigE (DUF2233 family)
MISSLKLLFISMNIILGLLTWSIPAEAEDLSICEKGPETVPAQIRCSLWNIMAFMSPVGGEASTRSTGLVSIGQERWVQADISEQGWRSAWPNIIHLRFYQGRQNNLNLVEEIKDSGLDGLVISDVNDSYIRYQANELGLNLLRGLDPNLLSPLNADYLAKLRSMLGVLEKDRVIHEAFEWRELAPGLDYADIHLVRYVRLGENRMVVLRFDPGRYDIVPYSGLELNQGASLNIEGWGKILDQAVAVFNAGQYYPDNRYMGIFSKDGVDYGAGIHPTYKGLLLSGGPDQVAERAPTTISDLDHEAVESETALYRFAVQSFMLLDRRGQPRVRYTDRLASRTVVGQDSSQRILVVIIPGACTLYELAMVLKNADLDITQAMSLDGGFETQLLVRTSQGKIVEYGSWVVNDRRQYHNALLKVGLPAVLAVTPRKK